MLSAMDGSIPTPGQRTPPRPSSARSLAPGGEVTLGTAQESCKMPGGERAESQRPAQATPASCVYQLPQAVLRPQEQPGTWGWTVGPGRVWPLPTSSTMGAGEPAWDSVGRFPREVLSLLWCEPGTPSQASRPNLPTWPVPLLSQSRPLPDVTLRPQHDSHWATKAPGDPVPPRPRRLVPVACCTDHEATGHCLVCKTHAIMPPPDGHRGRGVTQPFSQSQGPVAGFELVLTIDTSLLYKYNLSFVS